MCKTASRIIRRKQLGGFSRQQFLITTGSFRRPQGLKSSSINLPKWRRRRNIVESECEDRVILNNSFRSVSIFFRRLFRLFWSTFCLKFRHKSRKKSPIKFWHQSTKIPFWGCDNHFFHVKKCVFQWWSSLTIVYWVLPWVWNDEWIGKRAHRRIFDDFRSNNFLFL